MSDQGDRDKRGFDDVAAAKSGVERATVTPIGFGSGARFDDQLDLDSPDHHFDDADSVDLSLVHADDAFLDALGAAGRSDDLADNELAALLTSWRDEVDAEPIAELVDPKLAVATVFAARSRSRRRPRLMVPIAAAAAAVAIALTGAATVAKDAQPGDTLWGLTKVLYADHARSVEAAESVRQDLNIAQTALDQGKLAEAKSKLEDAEAGLPSVASEDGKEDLAAQHADLWSKLPGAPGGGVVPPPAADPTLAPVPSTSSSPSSSPTTTERPSSSEPPSPSSPPPSSSPPVEPPPPSTAPSTSQVPRVDDPPQPDPGTTIPDQTGETGTGTVPDGGTETQPAE